MRKCDHSGVVTVPETRYAKSGGLNIAYQVVGDGPLDLVYVPKERGEHELKGVPGRRRVYAAV
jgi:hypothetical protein